MAHITDNLGLQFCGRITLDGTEYVAYWDGAYRHIIFAADWDREVAEDAFSGPDGYTDWCGSVDGPDDEMAVDVAQQMGLSYVNSLDGSCRRLDCE